MRLKNAVWSYVGVGILFLPMSLALGQDHSPMSEADMASWIAQARPELEKELGYPLPKVPRFQHASAALLGQVPDLDVAAHIKCRFPHLQKEALAPAINDAQAVNASATVARLVEGTDVILVRPENQLAIAGWDKSLHAAAAPEFLKLALIRETVRFALDRRYDLGRRRDACRDAEEWFALEALVEGRAQWVTRQLARKLGMEQFFPLLANRFRYVPDISADPALRTMSQSALRQRHWACTQGLEFFNYLADQAIAECERYAFTHPPTLKRWIENPDQYVRASKAHRPDLTADLVRLKTALAAGEWTSHEQPWTPEMVSQVAALLGDKNRAEKILAFWNEGRSLVWTQKAAPAIQVALSVARFETSAAARSYYGFALDLQRKRDELTNSSCGLPLRVIESRSRTIQVPGVDETVLSAKKLLPAGGGQAIGVSQLLARLGDRVVEITWHGTPAVLPWAESLIGNMKNEK